MEMAIVALKCNGNVKLEDSSREGSSGEAYVTYTRRKRPRPSATGSLAGGQYMKKLDSTMLNGSTYGKDAVARTGTHWRSVLENMLRLPDLSEGGGVQSCIRSALKSNPPGFTRKVKMTEASEDTAEPKDRSVNYCETQGQYPRPDISTNATLDGSNTEIDGQAKLNINTVKCQHIFLDILRSEQFALLCNLLCGSFQDSKIEKLFDFSLINSNMKNGEYEQSPGLFDKDIQKIWKKFQEIGQEMFSLASSLSTVSRASYQKQVGENLVHKAGEPKHEASQIVGDQKNSNVSHTTMQFPCESDRSTKPDQTEASGLYKVCTCKQCGSETDGKRRLICDGCEAVYHFSCAEPAIQEIPFRSWYCASCNKARRELPQPFQPSTQQDGLHGNCVVCDRLEVCATEKQFDESGSMAIPDDSRESSVSSMESEEPPEPSSTALSRLCKKCGTCEDEDKRFLTCGNSHCPYRFYHIRCLRSSQIASPQQRNRRCWYCPSCLCRACLNDKDDDKIVLCDGCDEAYHIYCMKPPRTSIPKGQWFCVQCSAARAREGMRMYERWILQQHGKKDANKSIETNRPMDVLLSAVDKLSSEEQLESRVKGEK